MFSLSFFDIYPETIEEAISTAEGALEYAGLEHYINTMHTRAADELRESGSFEHITNSIIYAYFYTAAELITEKTTHNADYYINCMDSHFYIDDQEI